jgi:hypothetical protein
MSALGLACVNKTGQACESCVLNCDLTERLFYCAWALPRFYTARVTRDRVEPAAGPAMSAVAPFATKNSLPKNGALPKRREGLGITTLRAVAYSV